MFRSVVLTATIFVLSGCVSVLPTPETPEGLYTIDVRDAPKVALDEVVLVREPEALRLFAGRNVVSIQDDGGARIVPGVRWGDSATRLMELGLLDLLDGENGAPAVSQRSGSTATYELAWRIADLTVNGAEARVDLDLTLLDARTRDPLAQTVLSRRATVSGDSGQRKIAALQNAAQSALIAASEFTASAVRDASLATD
ncbi:MAG: ABC-type transport auxiliary lipoprotein family protein [Pseudomonadota bacterium]